MEPAIYKVATVLFGLLVAAPASADCRQFFVKRQAVVVQQVAVPVYPPIYYSAGADIQAEALAVKVAALVEQKLALRQQQTAVHESPAVFAKCIRCHTGPEAAGGLALDGSPVSCHSYYRFGQIFGQGKNVPSKMHAVVTSATPEEKGAMADALLDLVADKSPPPPVVDGELQ